MKKALLVMLIGYISMVTIVSRAHGDEVNSCHLQLAGQVTVSTDRLLVTDAAGRRLEITRDNQVLLNDSAIQIDAGDRQAVANYQEQVRTVIPVIVDLALDAVEIGVEAVSEVFLSLAGTEPPVKLTEAIAAIRAEINNQVSRDSQTSRLSGSSGEMLQTLDSVINDAKPTLITSIMGALITNLGQTVSTGEGSFEQRLSSFATRLENIGGELESMIEIKAARLEEKAQGLCTQMAALQIAESRMQQVFPELRSLDLVQTAPPNSI